jgi:hypothetical protein
VTGTTIARSFALANTGTTGPLNVTAITHHGMVFQLLFP